MPRGRMRTLGAALVAAALHGVALGAIGAYVMPVRAPRAGEATTRGESVADLWVGIDDIAERPPVRDALVHREVATGARGARHVEAARTVDAPALAPAPPSTDGAPSDAWSPTFLPPVASAVGALTGGAMWHDVAPREPTAEASVRDAAHAADRAIGLSLGAPLKSVAHESIRRSRAPTTGRARIEVRTDADGAVIDARVLDATGAREGWDDAARAITVAARGRKLRVPSGATGLSVTLDVASYITTASGVSRGESKVHIASPMGTGDVKASPAPQPLRFNLIVGPNQVDARMHFGVGDLAHDATHPDRRTITVDVVEERAL